MFSEIVDITDSSFQPRKGFAYRLTYEEFSFILYPSSPGWVLIQNGGDPCITFLTERNPDTLSWRYRYGEPNTIIDEVITVIDEYNRNLKRNYDEEPVWL